MSLIDFCIKSISRSYKIISIEENFSIYEAKFLLKDHYLLAGTPSDLKKIFRDQHKSKDRVVLKFSVGVEDPVFIDPHDDRSISRKLQDVSEGLGRLENHEDFSLTIRIEKEDQVVDAENTCSIYSRDKFFEYLNGLTLQEALEKWDKFKAFERVVFLIWDDVAAFRTNSFLFISAYQHHKSLSDSWLCEHSNDIRESRVENRNRCAHFSNAYLIGLIPEDFCLIVGSGLESIDNHFRTLTSVLLLVFLSDFSVVEGQRLRYTLKGYKTFSSDFKVEAFAPVFQKELYSIYQWVYSDGNFIDKIGLARNVITLHCPGDDLLNLEEGAALSVLSAYDIYLKDNVKQYIEVKNKILDFVHAQSDKSKDLVTGMFSTLKSTFWSVITFFISIFLLRVLVRKKESQLMTEEVSYVAFALIAISFLYLAVSVVEVNRDKRRLLKRYDDIKARYTDILRMEDIERILGKTDPKESEDQFISKQRNLFVLAWISSNLALLILVFFLRGL